MQILITVASLLFFGNKTLLLLGKNIKKRLGWFLGGLGAALFIVYFFMINTPILSILEIGLTILMTYRFFAKEKTNKLIENFLGILTGLSIITLTIVTHQGIMAWAQFFGAFGMLIGTYFLISANQIQDEKISIQERAGWILYAFGHFFTSYIGYQKHEWTFFVFQVWQMLLCLCGFAMMKTKDRRLLTIITLFIGAISALIFLIVINNI